MEFKQELETGTFKMIGNTENSLKIKEVAEKCIFDPICIERYKACGGCLFLNEISCQHFNHDLDRAFVIGHYDRSTKTKITGFWER